MKNLSINNQWKYIGYFLYLYLYQNKNYSASEIKKIDNLYTQNSTYITKILSTIQTPYKYKKVCNFCSCNYLEGRDITCIFCNCDQSIFKKTNYDIKNNYSEDDFDGDDSGDEDDFDEDDSGDEDDFDEDDSGDEDDFDGDDSGDEDDFDGDDSGDEDDFDGDDSGDDGMMDDGNDGMMDDGNDGMMDDGNDGMMDDGNDGMMDDGSQIPIADPNQTVPDTLMPDTTASPVSQVSDNSSIISTDLPSTYSNQTIAENAPNPKSEQSEQKDSSPNSEINPQQEAQSDEPIEDLKQTKSEKTVIQDETTSTKSITGKESNTYSGAPKSEKISPATEKNTSENAETEIEQKNVKKDVLISKNDTNSDTQDSKHETSQYDTDTNPDSQIDISSVINTKSDSITSPITPSFATFTEDLTGTNDVIFSEIPQTDPMNYSGPTTSEDF